MDVCMMTIFGGRSTCILCMCPVPVVIASISHYKNGDWR